MQKKNLYFFAHANEAIVFKKFFTDEITPNAIRRKKLNFALPKRLSSIITIYKEGIIATCGQNKNDILINVTQILTSLDGYIEQIFVLGTIGYFPSKPFPNDRRRCPYQTNITLARIPSCSRKRSFFFQLPFCPY